MSRVFLSRQFLLFLCTGGIAALVNFGSRIIYSQWLGFSTAIVMAYLTGMVTAFFLARWLVFRHSSQSLSRSGSYFALVNLGAVVQTWLISISMLRWGLPAVGWTVHPQEVAHAFGVVAPVFTSYLGHTRWSFR
jgi:putative flippase GtrA